MEIQMKERNQLPK